MEKMHSEIAVIAETVEGRPSPATLELIAFAKAIRRDGSLPVRVLVPGRRIASAAAELASLPGLFVTGIEGEALASYSAEAWKKVLAPLLSGMNPRWILASHSANGSDFAPGLAVRLRAACITAVEGFRAEGERLLFFRSILKGKLKMELAAEAETAVITLLPGAFRHADPFAPGEIGERPDAAAEMPETGPSVSEILSVGELSLETRALGRIPAPDGGAELAAAEVVVAAGRGIGGEENLDWIRRLATLFSRSAVGASRAVCDAGWLPFRFQIGQTGRTVSPRLYIACGISGALQHLAGMRGSRFVVSLNRDPQAAIFQVSDIAVVEELPSFIPLLIAACRSVQGRSPEAAR
jgi:electron transfer flavoprotein alpha subunit